MPNPLIPAPRTETTLLVHEAETILFVPTAPVRPVPLVPVPILKAFDVYIGPTEPRLTSACRLLAALWRRDHGLPAGRHHPEPRRARDGQARDPKSKDRNAKDPKSKDRQAKATRRKSVRLGSRLAPAAAQAGATFLTPAIAAHVREVLLYRESGALFEETRLWGNLLSSQSLTLNLLVPMALDLDLAGRVWRRLMPGLVDTVVGIRFEHSPGRRGPAYYGDGTALDAIIDTVDPDGRSCGLSLEVKYTEGVGGAVPAPRPRYAETARESGLYRDPAAAVLFRPGVEQLRREHVMSQLMLQHGLAGRGQFLLLGPAQNRHVAALGQAYAAELVDASEGPGRVGFGVLSLEAVVAALAEAGAGALAASFRARYLDLDRVARFVLDQPGPGAPARAPQPRRRAVESRAGA